MLVVISQPKWQLRLLLEPSHRAARLRYRRAVLTDLPTALPPEALTSAEIVYPAWVDRLRVVLQMKCGAGPLECRRIFEPLPGSGTPSQQHALGFATGATERSNARVKRKTFRDSRVKQLNGPTIQPMER
jgi:hypothetical protein